MLMGQRTEQIDLQLSLGITGTMGYLMHLVLDEAYSVDFNNKRIKRSFGTALSLFKKNRFINIFLLYIAFGTYRSLIKITTDIDLRFLFDRHVLGENTKPHKRPIPKIFPTSTQMTKVINPYQ